LRPTLLKPVRKPVTRNPEIRNQMLRHLPNALTAGNLLCGCAGIICAFTNPEIPTAWFVWAACVFDFFDGFSARILKVSSPIGKELDSLADLVSFGVLPAISMVIMLDGAGMMRWSLVGLLLAVFAALRLAKFNIDTRQSDSFIGVPTPAHALFICGLPSLMQIFPVGWFGPVVLLVITGLFSWLMVSPIPLFALKFKNFKWRENKMRFTFLLACVLLIAIFKAAGLPLAILLYIIVSLLFKAK
jgi:CDP-diacylglycerol---serine O-phosphatidyltransferase